MSTTDTFAHRALELIHELWDAIIEEEAILEESGLETDGLGEGTDVPRGPAP